MAGLSPNTPIYGRIHPEGLPGPDLLSDYRFFGIANCVNDMGGCDYARSDWQAGSAAQVWPVLAR